MYSSGLRPLGFLFALAFLVLPFPLSAQEISKQGNSPLESNDFQMGLQESVWKSESPSEAGGVEVKAAEVKVDGVAESLAVAESPR